MMQRYVASHEGEGAMLDVGVPELLIILVIVLVLFGPGRVAGLGRSLGETIRGFRHAVRDETEATTASPPAPPTPPSIDGRP